VLSRRPIHTYPYHLISSVVHGPIIPYTNFMGILSSLTKSYCLNRRTGCRTLEVSRRRLEVSRRRLEVRCQGLEGRTKGWRDVSIVDQTPSVLSRRPIHAYPYHLISSVVHGPIIPYTNFMGILSSLTKSSCLHRRTGCRTSKSCRRLEVSRRRLQVRCQGLEGRTKGWRDVSIVDRTPSVLCRRSHPYISIIT